VKELELELGKRRDVGEEKRREEDGVQGRWE
jgi:hypothetical protein